MITIKDVAKEANVTISTVSKVINNYPNISNETKDKVIKAISKLNYTPNQIAASLRMKNKNRIALIIKTNGCSSETAMTYMKYIVKYAYDLHYDIFTVFYKMIKDQSKEEVIKYLLSQGIRAIIVFGTKKNDGIIQDLIDSNLFKTVLLDAPIHNENTSSIWINQRQAQYDVIKKTIEINEGKVNSFLYITGSAHSYVTLERIKGALKYAKDNNLKICIKNGHFHEKMAYNLTIKYGKDYDLIVCASDVMAIASMNALIKQDIFRPVCGFDGLSLMGYAGKRMNTVKQDFKDISKKAILEINSLLKGNPGKLIESNYELARIEYEDVIK